MKVVMQIEIAVKVNGKLVKRLVETVDGTLEEMEETVDALSRKVASQTLQASVDAVEVPRPFFGGRRAVASQGLPNANPRRAERKRCRSSSEVSRRTDREDCVSFG